MGPFFNDFIGAIYSTPQLTNIWYRNVYPNDMRIEIYACKDSDLVVGSILCECNKGDVYTQARYTAGSEWPF